MFDPTGGFLCQNLPSRKRAGFVRCGKFRFYHADLHHHSYLLPFAGRTGRFRFYRFWNLGTDNFCRCLNSGSTFPFSRSACRLQGNEEKNVFFVSGCRCHWIAAAFLFRKLDFLHDSLCNHPESVTARATSFMIPCWSMSPRNDRMDRISS